MESDMHARYSTSRKLRREELASTAFLIEQDFRRLVDTLYRNLEIADETDSQLVERIVRVKDVAERGVRLSRLLTRLTHRPRD